MTGVYALDGIEASRDPDVGRPDDPADRLSRKCGIRHHAVIKVRVTAGQAVCAANLFFSCHINSSKGFVPERSRRSRRSLYTIESVLTAL